MSKDFCIIMVGGVGSRFWPFSRQDYPKQFLDFMGTGSSLLQMTYNRFDGLIPNENIYFVTNASYKGIIQEQLPQVKDEQILLEPVRRNTAPCIAYAAYKVQKICPDARIIVVPSDHIILQQENYIKAVKRGFEYLKEENCILTLGMRPTRPETGYGYIQVKDTNENPTQVKTFTEKPNREMAQLFIDSGEFYWNSGMFFFNVHTIIEALNKYVPEIANKFEDQKKVFGTQDEQKIINEIYPTFPSISIDYGVMEKAQNVSVLIADFGWSDCGTWDSLYEISEKDGNGNVALGCRGQFYDSKNNLIALRNGQLAVVDGLEGYIVAESDGVLMICKKDNEQKIRQYVNDINVKYNGKFN